MPLLAVPKEIRVSIYDAVLSPLLAEPAYYKLYVLPEEWPKKSFADYHSLLLTCKDISNEIQHLFLSVYVDKTTIFFDDCPTIYFFAERLCVHAEQGKRLQDMRLSLRGPHQSLWSLYWLNYQYEGVYCCARNTLGGYPLLDVLPTDPTVHPIPYLLQHGVGHRRGQGTAMSAAFQVSSTALASLEIHGVLGSDKMLHHSTYVELKTTFAALSWHNWVCGDSAKRPGLHGNFAEEARETLQRIRRMLASTANVEDYEEEVVEGQVVGDGSGGTSERYASRFT